MQGRALPADRGRPPPRERESPGKPESRRRPDSRREPESPRLFMEGCFDAMLLLDTRGRVLDANSAASVMVGRPVAGMRGKTVGALVGLRRHAADKDAPARRDITELEGTLCTLRRADHADLTVVLRKAEYGAGRQIWVLRDVTQSRPIADALERKARLLMEAERVGRMGAWELDIHTGLVIWTAELQRLMEVEESGVLTVEESNTFYTGPSRAIVREAFKATMNHGTPYDLELEVVTGHGRRMWVRETCRPSFRNGRLSSLVGVLQDISERRRMADLLAKRADIERERIGADLHDGLGQELTGLALLLEAAATRRARRSRRCGR
jgi:PAS domain-containing protein